MISEHMCKTNALLVVIIPQSSHWLNNFRNCALMIPGVTRASSFSNNLPIFLSSRVNRDCLGAGRCATRSIGSPISSKRPSQLPLQFFTWQPLSLTHLCVRPFQGSRWARCCIHTQNLSPMFRWVNDSWRDLLSSLCERALSPNVEQWSSLSLTS